MLSSKIAPLHRRFSSVTNLLYFHAKSSTKFIANLFHIAPKKCIICTTIENLCRKRCLHNAHMFCLVRFIEREMV